MLSNYLKIALRNLFRNSLYSALNISGLAVGIAACILILLFVTGELSYDRWNPLADRIVRPTYDIRFGGMDDHYASVDATVGPEAAASLPEIQSWCRIGARGGSLVRPDGAAANQNIRIDQVLFADSTFFDLFPLHLLAGDPRRCLNQPEMTAISRSCAERFFASPQTALGQTLLFDNQFRRQVSAVYEDMPYNSHFHADLLVSLSGNEEVRKTPPYWGFNNNFNTYLLLRKGTDKVAFAKKFEAMAAMKVGLMLKDLVGSSTEDFEKAGQHAQFHLQNMTDIHLHSGRKGELDANGNIRYVWIFSAIAFFILLIACINFMNLATARSAGRAREIGVRKVLGSTRSALARQFLTESVTLSVFSVLLATGLASLAMPGFRELSGRNLSMPWGNPLFWVSLAGGALGTGLLAGSYPAFFLSAFNTVNVLKGNSPAKQSRGGVSFRNGLVVFQFTISTVLIISTLLVYRQLQYIRNMQPGYDRKQVLVVKNAYALGDRLEAFKQEMLLNANVESATLSGYLPIPSDRGYDLLSVNRVFKETDKVMQRWRVDAGYIPTLGMEIKQGRNFDPSRITDQSAVILNETAARQFGFTDPVGQTVYSANNKTDAKPEDFEALNVIGVVRDFHFSSLHDPIGPLYLRLGPPGGLASFRIKGANAAGVIATLERKWNSLIPDLPFRYEFLDDAFNRMYDSERRIGAISTIFALLSVLVSCLGLFGLACYTTQQRTREIGIRKVLGASVAGIVALLTRDMLQLVALAILIAAPIAYYFMNKWLADYAYRIQIGGWIFALAGLLAVSIAFATVGLRSLAAATANPVDSLRSE